MSLVWHRLRFPKDLQPEAVVSLMRTLAMRPRTGLLRVSSPVVFELTLTATGATWWLGTEEHQVDWLLNQLRSTTTDVGAEPVDRDEQISSADALAAELRVRSPRRPLRTDLPTAAANALLSVQPELREEESLTVQWLVGPWLPRHVPKPSTPSQSHWLSDLADLVVEEKLDFRDARALDRKQTEAVFGCVGRIATIAGTDARRRLLLQRAVGAVQLVREPGAGFSRRVLPSFWVHEQMTHYRVPLVAWPCPLNASELAELVAWPTEGVHTPGTVLSRQRLLAPDPAVVTTPSGAEGQRIVGEVTHPSVNGLLQLDAVAALQHLHVIGPTGAGKSTLLARLVLADIAAGRSVVVVEPKGDLIAEILERIPDQRTDDVVLLDPTDGEHPVGFNPLRGADPELAVDQVVHAMHSMYAAFWGPRTHDILHAGLLTLARAGDYTLIDLPNVLTDEQLRRHVVTRAGEDPALGQFWSWYETLSARDRETAIGPVMNKLRAFSIRTAIRRTLGQTTSAFRWTRTFTRPTVLLVNLAKGRLGPETAHLLGSLVVSQLWQAVLHRSTRPPAERTPAMVYVDEFRDYTRLPTDLGDALAQARGLGVGVTLAHQHLGQLDADLRAAVLNNARSRVVFQTGEDAAPLAKSLGGTITTEDLRELEAYHAYAALVSGGAVTRPASIRTLPLDPGTGSAERVRKRSRQQWGQAVGDIEEATRQRWNPGGTSSPGGAVGGTQEAVMSLPVALPLPHTNSSRNCCECRVRVAELVTTLPVKEVRP